MSHPLGEVELIPLEDGRHRIEVRAGDLYVQRNGWVTGYPVPLIERILELKGPSYLCDEIARDEDPLYVPLNLETSLFGFVGPGHFGPGARILDFGCGTGASCVFLGRSFPEAEIVGVELLGPSLEVARARCEHHGIGNVRFLTSPSGDELPPELGLFDGVILSAVFEHLLPAERLTIMPLLASVLKPGGILFINETPNRLFPVELHTTGLPLINYLPASWALGLSRRFSRRVDPGASWEQLLREGIRGGTRREILARLPGEGWRPMPVIREGLRDEIDIWYDRSLRKSGPSWKKSLFRAAARLLRRLTGRTFTPEVVMALRRP